MFTLPDKNDRTGKSSRDGTPEGRLPAICPGTGLGEFWCSEEDGRPMDEDPLLELRAGAEKAKFQILLVSEFDRIGRVPLECSAAAAFFERHGVEVWTVTGGHEGKFVRLEAAVAK